MEGALMAFALLAIILLLSGYRRVTRRENHDDAKWLFAYRVDRDGEASRARNTRK